MKYRIKLPYPKEVINYRRYHKKYKKRVKGINNELTDNC